MKSNLIVLLCLSVLAAVASGCRSRPEPPPATPAPAAQSTPPPDVQIGPPGTPRTRL